MSKFSVKVKLKELEIEVEGSREDVPRLAQNVGEQVGNLIKPALLLEAAKPANGHADISEASEPERRRRGRRSVGGAAGRTPGEEITVSIDPATHGSPRQEWKTAEKAIWFLYVVRNSYGAGLTAHSVAKGFNKHFKSAGAIIAGNVGRDLEKERLKGTRCDRRRRYERWCRKVLFD